MPRTALALLLASALLASCGSKTDLSASDAGPGGDSAFCTTLPVPRMADPTRWAVEARTRCPACPDAAFSGTGFSLRRGEPLIATPEPLVEGAFVWEDAAADAQGTRITLRGDRGEVALRLRGVAPGELAWVPRGLAVEAVLQVLPVPAIAVIEPFARGTWELVDGGGRRLVRSFFEGPADALPLTDAQRARFVAPDRETTTEPFFLVWEGVRFLGGNRLICEEDNFPFPLGRVHLRGVLALEADGTRREAPPGQSLDVRLGDAAARVRGAFRTCFLRSEDRGVPPVGTGYCSRGIGAEVLAVRVAP